MTFYDKVQNLHHLSERVKITSIISSALTDLPYHWKTDQSKQALKYEWLKFHSDFRKINLKKIRYFQQSFHCFCKFLTDC